MTSATDKLFTIIDSLNDAKIHFGLSVTRDDAITIEAAVPGERWEIDVFRDGNVELEVFCTAGGLVGETELAQRILRFSD